MAVMADFILPDYNDRILPELINGEYHLFYADQKNGGRPQAE